MSLMRESSFPYLPHTDADRQAMLAEIGVRSFEELIEHIPESLRVDMLDLPTGLSEPELVEKITSLAARNKPASSQAAFLGGGSWRRFVPAAVPYLVSRSEFATAYTPYQPEVSQGSLQAIYEFQTAVCLLTGMEVANASMYDGATACAEAALMAARITGRNRIVISDAVNPEYRLVTRTYTDACALEVTEASSLRGRTLASDLQADERTAAIIVQQPNYFGCLEPLGDLIAQAKRRGAIAIVVTEPVSLALLKSPGEFAADIVVGDAQPCGNFLSFGGPSAGYMATLKKHVRQLPGRLAGMTVDRNGKPAFTLTLQTREQHIRRARATSNICTNQALNALAMLVYLCLMGPKGLRKVAEVSVRRAHYLAEKLCSIPGVRLALPAPFFNEFLIESIHPADRLLEKLAEKDILGGIAMGRFYKDMPRHILVAVTEMNTPEQLDLYAKSLAEILSTGKGLSLIHI